MPRHTGATEDAARRRFAAAGARRIRRAVHLSRLPKVKIVCLLKQVPEPTAIEFDDETKTLKREGVPLILNPFDRGAVAEAVRLRDAEGGEVVAMSMGPPQAEDALREALGMGADRAILLSDRVFAVADTLGTSRTLALALRKEGFDLVLCGRKTVDSETWQVPPEVAAFLGVPHLTNVASIEDGRAVRQTDTGEAAFELTPPAVVSIAHAMTDPGSPTGTVETWAASDLVDDVREDDKRFGQTGSPTRVLAVRDVTPERAGLTHSSAAEARAAIEALLAERPPPESSWDKPENIAEKPAASYDSWTLIELDRGRPTRHSLELLARSRTLAGKLGGRNVALVLGAGLDAVPRELTRHGAEVVVVVDDERLAAYQPEVWTSALRQVLERERPHVLLIPASAFGRDLGPRAAGDLELGMTGDCVAVDIAKAGRLLQTKPAYGGNIVSVIMGATTPQLATVRARMYEPLEPDDSAQAETRAFAVQDLPEAQVRLIEESHDEQTGLDLDAADVVLFAGRQAELTGLDGVPVGGSHPELPPQRQIGLYGRPVAPRLLVGIGLDGTPEELAGFVKAAVVVSVGAQPKEWADISFDGDWRDLVSNLPGES
jgi:electron transfer flavoprotein alpha subunit